MKITIVARVVLMCLAGIYRKVPGISTAKSSVMKPMNIYQLFPGFLSSN